MERHYAYILLQDEAAAERFLASFAAAVARIGEMPAIGSPRLWRNAALRGVRAWPLPDYRQYVVFYVRSAPDLIRILRVLRAEAMPHGPLTSPA